MKSLILATGLLLATTMGVNAAQPLTDKQMDKITAGDTSYSFTGAFTITSLVQTGNFISLTGTCMGSCSVMTHSSSFSP